ncbi:MAG: hypothetical protein JNK49_11440, partial [Planctomycetes bacterium]|nr:hypothetical protein [Planctomycetota bacterium]
TAAAAALSNTSFTMAPTGSGYVVTSGGASFVPPSGGAVSLVLADDSDVDTPALTTPFPYIGGAAGTLRVCSNGYVSVASGNGTGFLPDVPTFLNAPQTGWWTWHDFNPAAVGSGQVKFEEVGSMVYVTWDGVYNYLGTTAADASTMQYQFDCSTGNVGIVFGTLSALGNPWLVGYSPAGANLNPGSIDLATALPVVLSADTAPLALAASARPVLGTSYSYDITNIPGTSLISSVLISLGGASGPVAGAPGCFQYVNLFLTSSNLVFGSPSGSFPITLPSGTGFIGLQLHTQAASLVPGVNPLGVLTSNGVISTLSNI